MIMPALDPFSNAPDSPYSEADLAKSKSEAAVASALAGREEGLILGKFKSYEELEKSYQELQSLLGKRGQALPAQEEDEEEEPLPEDEDELEEEEEPKAKRKGKKETPDEGIPRAEVERITAEFGGEKRISKMLSWFEENADNALIDRYNKQVASSDPAVVEAALAWLERRWRKATNQRSRLEGGQFAQSKDVFRSNEEMIRAMEDPRYQSDPAYVQDVIAKIARSNF